MTSWPRPNKIYFNTQQYATRNVYCYNNKNNNYYYYYYNYYYYYYYNYYYSVTDMQCVLCYVLLCLISAF